MDGAKETLDRAVILIVEVECFPFWDRQVLAEDVLDKLRSAGFSPILRDREYDDVQFNVLCVRNSEFLPEIQRRAGLVSGNAAVLKKKLPTLQARNVPVIVPCFNNPTFCLKMLQTLQKNGFEEITFVDNASSEIRMHEVLEELEAKGAAVERLSDNVGPRDSVFTDERLARLPRYFCVTDPDIEFNPALPENFLGEMAGAMARWERGKIGFALDISDRGTLKKEKFKIQDTKEFHIWEWEEQFWQNRLGFTTANDPIYEASVDTTFALYDQVKFSKSTFFQSLRIAGRYTATHSPWKAHSVLPETEENKYRETQKHSFYLGHQISTQ